MLETLHASTAVGNLARNTRQPGPAIACPHALQGQWQIVHGIRDGRQAHYLRGRRLTIEADRFVIRGERGDMIFQGTIAVAVDADPATLDLHHADDTLDGNVWKGIYHLDGNSLRLCTNSPNPRGPWPQEFAATAGSRNALVLLRRL